MGAPRLHEWTARPTPHLSTRRTSSRVAPASSAPRICRRVPASSRFVQEQLSAREISSTSLRGKTPLFHGFAPTRKSSSAPWGSQSLILSRDEPHGFTDWTVAEAFVAPLCVLICLLLVFHLLCSHTKALGNPSQPLGPTATAGANNSFSHSPA